MFPLTRDTNIYPNSNNDDHDDIGDDDDDDTGDLHLNRFYNHLMRIVRDFFNHAPCIADNLFKADKLNHTTSLLEKHNKYKLDSLKIFKENVKNEKDMAQFFRMMELGEIKCCTIFNDLINYLLEIFKSLKLESLNLKDQQLFSLLQEVSKSENDIKLGIINFLRKIDVYNERIKRYFITQLSGLNYPEPSSSSSSSSSDLSRYTFLWTIQLILLMFDQYTKEDVQYALLQIKNSNVKNLLGEYALDPKYIQKTHDEFWKKYSSEITDYFEDSFWVDFIYYLNDIFEYIDYELMKTAGIDYSHIWYCLKRELSMSKQALEYGRTFTEIKDNIIQNLRNLSEYFKNSKWEELTGKVLAAVIPEEFLESNDIIKLEKTPPEKEEIKIIMESKEKEKKEMTNVVEEEEVTKKGKEKKKRKEPKKRRSSSINDVEIIKEQEEEEVEKKIKRKRNDSSR